MSQMVKAVQRNARHSSQPSQLQLDDKSWAQVGDLVGLDIDSSDGEIWRVTNIVSVPFKIATRQWSGMIVDAEFVRMADPMYLN
ncbi:hypothetical protein MF271_19335 (plasmid) [Deinococcus sp. KNUC1210]|uniref:hypothetical protein n=1 Tax=Deinococcus sp. KNUC1210 TaxID=2917691 RepID=UPI001EF0B0D3|nr:hypothetical protein [Deinococcus sp. KNUC1210]ULH17345.1 hypothetical protein MF271_19335 [Deinococcus sp. KNUC1210]